MTWRFRGASWAVLVVAACGGTTRIEGGGGGASSSTATGGAGGTGASSGSGGAGGDPAWTAFCEEAIPQSTGVCANDLDRCLASASCEDVLRQGPGDPLFACIATSGCESCLIELYVDAELTPAGSAFGEACAAAIQEGCGIFEDLCLAGALFTDAHLEAMTACYELPTCEQTEACITERYHACLGWAYAFAD